MMNLCPFLNEPCREECMFHCNHLISTTHVGLSPCLIAVKLDQINEYNHDDLVNVVAAIEGE